MIQTSLSTYTGPAFLAFYAAAMMAAVVAGIWLPRYLRPDGRLRIVTERLELAYLSGKAARVTDTILAGLYGRGAIGLADKNRLVVDRPDLAEDEGERTILAIAGPFGMGDARKALRPVVAKVEDRLRQNGLLMPDAERTTLRILSILPFVMVLMLGWYRRAAGLAVGEPVGLLTMMMLVLGVLAIFRFAMVDPRTRSGQEAVAETRSRSDRLRLAPAQGEVSLGVALFGTAVLVGTPYAELHAMRRQAGADGGGGCGGGGGDGDGGGGGCGGCGG